MKRISTFHEEYEQIKKDLDDLIEGKKGNLTYGEAKEELNKKYGKHVAVSRAAFSTRLLRYRRHNRPAKRIYI